MYHCHTQFYLMGAQQEVWDQIKSMPPLESFTHDFDESAALDSALLARADVIFADVCSGEGQDALDTLLTGKRAAAQLILLATREQLPDMACLGSDVADIWTLPISVEELSFRFLRWQQAYKLEKDHWQTEHFLEACLDSSPSLIWYKRRDGIHEKVNESFCKTVNMTKQQVEGHGHAYIWGVDGEDPACVQSELEVMSKRKTFVSDEIVQTRGGGLMLLETYKSPLFDLDGSVMGTVGVAKDVTKERAYEKQLLDKTRMLEMYSTFLADNTNDVYLMLDETACDVEFVSPNAERVLGISSEQILNDIKVLGHAEYINGGGVGVEELEAMKPGMALEPRETCRINPETWEEKWFHESVHCVSVQGVKKFIVYISDRTKERMIQNALSQALNVAQAEGRAKGPAQD